MIKEGDTMQMYLYTTSSEANRLEKTLENEVRIAVTFRDVRSLIDPVLQITNPAILQSNYVYFPEIARYYFIKRITENRTGLYEVQLHIDVLMTYKEAIRNLQVVVSGSNSNPYYNDYINGFDVRMDTETLQFDSDCFNEDGEFILVALYGRDRGLS